MLCLLDECDKPKEIPTKRNTETTTELLLKQQRKIKQLTRELEIERSNSQNHEAKLTNLVQELTSEKASNSSLQELVAKLKQDLTRETTFSQQHRELVERLQQSRQSEQVRLRELSDCKDALSRKAFELEKTHRDQRQEWIMKEKSLSNKVTQLQLDVTVATQTTAKVQKELEDERTEKTEFATKERHLKELNQRLNHQEREISQAMQKLKQEIASEQTICNSLKAEKLELQDQRKLLQDELKSVHKKLQELQDQQKILQAELKSVQTVRDSQANLIRSERTLQKKETNKRTAAEEKLRNVTLEFEQAEQQKLLTLTELNTGKLPFYL